MVASVFNWFVLGPLPGLLVSLLLWIGKALHDRRSNRRRWILSDPSRVRICISASPSIATGAYSRPTTGVGQAKALAQISPSLTKAWRDIDIQSVYFADEIAGSDLETDLILIGGPKTNALTARVLEIVGEDLGVYQDGSTIIVEDKHLEGEVDDNATGYDYGLVMRIRNPFSSVHRLIVLSGSHTFGTVAAARFMASAPFMSEHSGDLAVVIGASVEKGHALEGVVEWSSNAA